MPGDECIEGVKHPSPQRDGVPAARPTPFTHFQPEWTDSKDMVALPIIGQQKFKEYSSFIKRRPESQGIN